MVRHMSEIAKMGLELSVEERALFSSAFKNAVGLRRQAWRALTMLEQKEKFRDGGTAAKGSSTRALYDQFTTTNTETDERENITSNAEDALGLGAVGCHKGSSVPEDFTSVAAMVDWLHSSAPLVLKAAEEMTEPGKLTEMDEQLNNQLLECFHDTTAPDLADAALEFLLRPLARICLSTTTAAKDTSRLAACQMLARLISSCGDAHLVSTAPYLISNLVRRLNCGDLDGVLGVPEKMRPLPEQRPQQMAHAEGREACEEVREQIAELVIRLLGRVSGKPTVLIQSIDEIVSLVRGLMLDDFGKIKMLGCKACEMLSDAHAPLLLHFGEAMARSASSCLTHNHMQVRIAGLRAVTACLKTTTWKHSFDIIAHLTAWSDPNQVPVKAFYESTTKINYLTTLCFDRHIAVELRLGLYPTARAQVRRFFYQTLGHWLLTLEDSIDIEPHVMPFFLTGLFDDDYSVRVLVFALIGKVGEKYEKMNEVELREKRQLGLDASWTYDGRASEIPFLPLVHGVHQGLASGAGLFDIKDYDWPLMADLVTCPRVTDISRRVSTGEPVHRPRLGARCWVRTSARRFILATLNQVTDFKECNALNATRLLAVLVGFVEEGVTEWLKEIITAAQRVYLGRSGDKDSQAETEDEFDLVLTMIGRYVEPQAWWGLLSHDLSSESLLEDEWRIASVKVLSLLFKGAMEVYRECCSLEGPPTASRCQALYNPLLNSVYASPLMTSRTLGTRETFLSILRTLSTANDFDHFGPGRNKFIACELLLKSPQDGRLPSRVDFVAADADVKRAAMLIKNVISKDAHASRKVGFLLKNVGDKEIDAAVEMMLYDDDDSFHHITVALTLRFVVWGRSSIEIVHRHLETMACTSTASPSARQTAVAILTRDIASGLCGAEVPSHSSFYKALIGTPEARPRQLQELLAAAYALGTVGTPSTNGDGLIGSLITAMADHTIDKRLRDIWEKESRVEDPSFKQLKIIREAATRVVEIARLQTALSVALAVAASPSLGKMELMGALLEVLECPPEQHGKIAKPPSAGIVIYTIHTITRLLSESTDMKLLPMELCSEAPRLCSIGFRNPTTLPGLVGRDELAERIIEACADTIASTLNLSFPVDPNHPQMPVPTDLKLMDITSASVEQPTRRQGLLPGIWDVHDIAPLVSRPAWVLFDSQYGKEAQKAMAENGRPPFEEGLKWNAALAVIQLLSSAVKTNPAAATR
ncbi:hypothetical protein FOL47_002763 [Perkinsus chesapeaki]|uniref:Uncharacterized protein n=1 Tax=Perkinsus chesapeaki TaxID=330153 RepID=A0A7J6N1B5_PERCH|nr:hypothetical protein FOL47_002763 [Perkinsus chesapeaki]